jgi:hypothetical protein
MKVRIAGYWLILILAFAPLIAMALILPTLGDTADRIALKNAELNGALLFKTNFGLSPVLCVFCWFVWVFAIFWNADEVWRGLHKSHFVFERFGTRVRCVARSRRRAATETFSKDPEPARFARKKTRRGKVWGMLLAAVVLIGATVGFVVREIQAYSILTATAYVESPLQLRSSSVSRPWSMAVSVELGCHHYDAPRRRYHAPRRGPSNTLVYDIRFPDGASVRISETVPLQGSWLDAAEAIERALNEGGAEFARWRWLGQDPLHPKCLQWLRDSHTAYDYARIWRLLRVGEIPDR